MKILCAIKRVVDANVNVVVKNDGSGIDLNNVKMSVNPFCEIGVEQAIQLKEAGIADEIVAVCVGSAKTQEQVRVCLALGADRGIIVDAPDDLEPLTIAKVLKAVYTKEQPQLVIFGKQSIDGDNSQTGQVFAALTDLPQATFASDLSISDNLATVVREVDGGLQTLQVPLPMVLTTDLRLNVPRFASLKNIMMSKRKQIDVLSAEELGVVLERRTETLRVDRPPARSAGIVVKSIDELVSKLRDEAKVLP
ncbi:MAG: electron transfer flavoprotein subunit beta/FixA family protein [Gammaproteobacteria bacterium]|nr:electron transfer flavoprotein subunit beta/FixA family protein [Gammaproteobacteria bacterium]MYF02271.1 electron transfer flavoprotein subunit beta/FixA family protein [Gammaproteobacteria bacterium]MYI76833.1 electron transfer flavoprotein subunit beta/FixA family protein [Gammaproteobacteria bacterium]